MTPTKIALAAAIALATPAIASASTAGEKIAACKAEIRAQLTDVAPEAEIDFRKIKQTSRKATISFRVKSDGESDKLRCKAKSGEPVEIVWGDTLRPLDVKMVETKTKAQKAGGN